jgi:hypothetical protein
MSGQALTRQGAREILGRYLSILQAHPAADEMMERILTEDFETGFIGGQVWRGLEGLRDFLSQREGFFDERHEIEEVLELDAAAEEASARTRLHFFLRRWQPPAAKSEEFTGRCFHTWRLRRIDGEWRVAAQLVERFEDLNESAARLFSTPEQGLHR